jgi:lysophospholipase L1-like esterase
MVLLAVLFEVALLGAKLAAVAPFAGVPGSTQEAPVLDMSALTARTFIAYGHSYIAGDQERYLTPWITSAGQALRMGVVNLGVGGTTSSYTLGVVDKTWPRGEHIPARPLVIVECTLNDVRRYGAGGLRNYVSNISRIFSRLNSAVPRPRVVLVLDVPIARWTGYAPDNHGSGKLLNEYDDAGRSAAERAGVAIADPRVGWSPAAMLSSDGVHPDALGARHIAAAVERVVQHQGRA